MVPKDSWHYWFLLAALPTVSRRLLGIAPQVFDECKVEDQGRMPGLPTTGISLVSATLNDLA
jgi:hypothetical protein